MPASIACRLERGEVIDPPLIDWEIYMPRVPAKIREKIETLLAAIHYMAEPLTAERILKLRPHARQFPFELEVMDIVEASVCAFKRPEKEDP